MKIKVFLMVLFVAIVPVVAGAMPATGDTLEIMIGDTVLLELAMQDTLEDSRDPRGFSIDTSGVGLYTVQTKSEVLTLWDTLIAQRQFLFNGDEVIDISGSFLLAGVYLIRAKVERFVESNPPGQQLLPEMAWSPVLTVVISGADTRRLRTVRIRFLTK